MSQSSISDLDSPDDESWPPSPPNLFTGKSCPVCGKLNVDIVVGKDNASSLEYCIEPGEQNHDLLSQWIEECDLCKLVYDLGQHWSEQGDNKQHMEYVGYNYWYACGRNGSAPLHLEILADWGESRSTCPRTRSWSDATLVYRQRATRTYGPCCGACRPSVEELYSTDATLGSQM